MTDKYIFILSLLVICEDLLMKIFPQKISICLALNSTVINKRKKKHAISQKLMYITFLTRPSQKYFRIHWKESCSGNQPLISSIILENLSFFII